MVALNETYRKTLTPSSAHRDLHRKPLTPDRSAKDSGLRFYSAEISRWLSRDPITEGGGLNLYVFVGNTPVHYLDPNGTGPVVASPATIGELISQASTPGQVNPQSALGEILTLTQKTPQDVANEFYLVGTVQAPAEGGGPGGGMIAYSFVPRKLKCPACSKYIIQYVQEWKMPLTPGEFKPLLAGIKTQPEFAEGWILNDQGEAKGLDVIATIITLGIDPYIMIAGQKVPVGGVKSIKRLSSCCGVYDNKTIPDPPGYMQWPPPGDASKMKCVPGTKMIQQFSCGLQVKVGAGSTGYKSIPTEVKDLPLSFWPN
jgi:RHS repeat-associated protein